MIRVQAVIDTRALAHNLARVREYAPGRAVYAALKADAYGHGALTAAAALADADGFAVSSIDEALALRRAGVDRPLMTLSQPLDPATCAQLGEHAIAAVVFHDHQLTALAAHEGAAIRVWIKLDTGMHRLGFAAPRAAELEAAVAAMPRVELAGWLTHLACADAPQDAQTPCQLACFAAAVDGRAGQRSIANSAGVLAWPDSHADMVRPGIMLYGCSPLFNRGASECGLKPAMHLSAPLISRQIVAAGEPVGYGAAWHAPETMPVGIVGIGYGDGYPRHAPSGTPTLIHGARAPLVGRVSMDMLAIDLRRAPQARVGDRVTLWGSGLPAEEVAAHADTIAYELFCRLTPRVSYEVV